MANLMTLDVLPPRAGIRCDIGVDAELAFPAALRFQAFEMDTDRESEWSGEFVINSPSDLPIALEWEAFTWPDAAPVPPRDRWSTPNTDGIYVAPHRHLFVVHRHPQPDDYDHKPNASRWHVHFWWRHTHG